MSEAQQISVLETTRLRLEEIVRRENLLNAAVSVLARQLTPEEAIGTPGRRDFPIIIGKERVIEATVLGSKGHAFTDSPQEFTGTIEEVLNLELNTNQHRAIYVATLNAVLRHLHRVTATVHCKDEDPEKCALEIAAQLFMQYGQTNIGLIGLNPAIAERLVDKFGIDHVRITDLSRDNIGQRRFGVEVWDGNTRTEDIIEASDVVVFTGTTLVNDTFGHIWKLIHARKKNYLVYGVTAAGICELLDIQRGCPYGQDE